MDDSHTGIERFDAVIIGAGQAAKPLALALGEAGWKAAGRARARGRFLRELRCTPKSSAEAIRSNGRTLRTRNCCCEPAIPGRDS
jgi:hypothetical protein